MDDFAAKSPAEGHVCPRGRFWPDFAHVPVDCVAAELTLADVGGHAGGVGAREGSGLFPRDLPRDSRLSLPGILLPGILLPRGVHRHSDGRGRPE